MLVVTVGMTKMLLLPHGTFELNVVLMIFVWTQFIGSVPLTKVLVINPVIVQFPVIVIPVPVIPPLKVARPVQDNGRFIWTVCNTLFAVPVLPICIIPPVAPVPILILPVRPWAVPIFNVLLFWFDPIKRVSPLLHYKFAF